MENGYLRRIGSITYREIIIKGILDGTNGAHRQGSLCFLQNPQTRSGG